MLIYSGVAHLMAEISEVVVRRWHARLPEMVRTCSDLVTNAHTAARAVQAGDLAVLGRCLGTYWEQKKVMAPGCEPALITQLMHAMREAGLVHGVSLGGGGGGGFCVAITKEPDALGAVRAALRAALTPEHLGMLSFYDMEVDTEGITLDGAAPPGWDENEED